MYIGWVQHNIEKELHALFEKMHFFFGGYHSERYFSGAFDAPHARRGCGVCRSYVLERRTN